MERLTFKNGDEYWCVTNDNCFEEQSEHYCGPAIERLAYYEDAEAEGRLVVLPCKVGDTVWIPLIEKQKAYHMRVQGISISASGRTILRFGGYPFESAWGDACGKAWFFTREEAEAKLKGESNG